MVVRVEFLSRVVSVSALALSDPGVPGSHVITCLLVIEQARAFFREAQREDDNFCFSAGYRGSSDALFPRVKQEMPSGLCAFPASRGWRARHSGPRPAGCAAWA